MGLDVVGVEFHEAGDQQVAPAILAERGSTRRDAGDAPVREREAAVDDLVPEHDGGVAEDLWAHGVAVVEGAGAGPKG